MRDKKRIDRILDDLKERWKNEPDQRFYQLLINLGLIQDGQMWHIEDDEVEEHLKKVTLFTNKEKDKLAKEVQKLSVAKHNLRKLKKIDTEGLKEIIEMKKKLRAK